MEDILEKVSFRLLGSSDLFAGESHHNSTPPTSESHEMMSLATQVKTVQKMCSRMDISKTGFLADGRSPPPICARTPCLIASSSCRQVLRASSHSKPGCLNTGVVKEEIIAR